MNENRYGNERVKKDGNMFTVSIAIRHATTKNARNFPRNLLGGSEKREEVSTIGFCPPAANIVAHRRLRLISSVLEVF